MHHRLADAQCRIAPVNDLVLRHIRGIGEGRAGAGVKQGTIVKAHLDGCVFLAGNVHDGFQLGKFVADFQIAKRIAVIYHRAHDAVHLHITAHRKKVGMRGQDMALGGGAVHLVQPGEGGYHLSRPLGAADEVVVLFKTAGDKVARAGIKADAIKVFHQRRPV